MITGCRKIHTEKLGRNPVSCSTQKIEDFIFVVFTISLFLQMGASGQKLSCEQCGSFDHLGTACKFQTAADVQASAKVTVSPHMRRVENYL